MSTSYSKVSTQTCNPNTQSTSKITARIQSNDSNEQEMARLQLELMKMQSWVNEEKVTLAVIFEGHRASVEHEPSFSNDVPYNATPTNSTASERMLARLCLMLIEDGRSASDEEQERRFQKRMKARARSWKLSSMNSDSRNRWGEYSRAKSAMFSHTGLKHMPWFEMQVDTKQSVRHTGVTQLLRMIKAKDLTSSHRVY